MLTNFQKNVTDIFLGLIRQKAASDFTQMQLPHVRPIERNGMVRNRNII